MYVDLVTITTRYTKWKVFQIVIELDAKPNTARGKNNTSEKHVLNYSCYKTDETLPELKTIL